MTTRTGGRLLVECLEAQGVERVFCVPGESYLEVLDALHDSSIETIVARQEGGAAMMAEAEGKMTGRPGVAMVTRGPGSTNAASGVHVARQDSTPMILFVGQIGRGMKGRDAFQEVDYRQTFRDLAKWVEEIDDADRIPEVVSHAFHVAMSGRPGPVVLALPEDMLTSATAAEPARRVEVAEPAPTPEAMAKFDALLKAAERPFLVLGGSRWDEDAVARVHAFAESHDLPVGVSFRRQGLFDHTHANYAGDVGLGINPKLKERLAGGGSADPARRTLFRDPEPELHADRHSAAETDAGPHPSRRGGARPHLPCGPRRQRHAGRLPACRGRPARTQWRARRRGACRLRRMVRGTAGDTRARCRWVPS